MTDKSALDALVSQCGVWVQPSRSFTAEGRTRDITVAAVASALLNLIAEQRASNNSSAVEVREYVLQSRVDEDSPWETWGTPYQEDEQPQILERLAQKRERYPEFQHQLALRTVVTTIENVTPETLAGFSHKTVEDES